MPAESVTPQAQQPRRAVRRYFRIAEAAQRVGVHPNTIRNLERRGLFTVPRDWSGQRRFSEADVQALCALVAPARGATARRGRRAA